jgi:hypothetical protein
MKTFGKRIWLFRIAVLVLALSGAAAIWAVPRFFKHRVSIKSQVTAYLLDDGGNVNGLLLASGDQLHFRPETGAAVVQRIAVGDEVTVVGHAGKQSNYGREIRVEQISARGQTILEIASGPPRPHGPGNHHGPDDRRDPESQPGPRVTAEMPATQPTEILKVTATARAHLVNGHGDVDGLILASGEQVRFGPRVGSLVVAAEQGGNTELNVEGQNVRSEWGVVIRPTSITVGNQTITLAGK